MAYFFCFGVVERDFRSGLCDYDILAVYREEAEIEGQCEEGERGNGVGRHCARRQTLLQMDLAVLHRTYIRHIRAQQEGHLSILWLIVSYKLWSRLSCSLYVQHIAQT